MKKAILILTTTLLFAASCTNKQQEDQDILQNQKIMDYLSNAYGFASEDIEETNDAFVAEGDILFPKEGFWETFGPREEVVASDRKHYHNTYLVTTTDYIKINIKPGVPATWITAIEDAVEEWNDLYGGLYFEVSYSNSHNNIYGAVNVSMNGTLPSTVFARGASPSNQGNPGSTLLINPKYNHLALSPKTLVIAHEIGHTIGFMHTDKGQGSLITEVSSSCRNNPDLNSVMRSGQKSNDLFLGFTSCDIEAYDALYYW